ncbi:MAG: transcription antitermination factor NusB, partial [Pseudomonadota bacterium]
MVNQKTSDTQKPSQARHARLERTAAKEAEPRSALIRCHAARALNQIINNRRTIDWLLQNRADWLVAPLAQELLYGTLRHYYSLSHSVSALLKKALRQKDQDLMCLLLVGAYQLRMLDIPTHAIVHETVEACRLLGKPWAKGLINGVLRQLERGPETQANRQTEQSFELPTWLARKLASQYPNPEPHGFPEIHSANLQRAPMTLRVNLCRTSVTEWLQKLPD